MNTLSVDIAGRRGAFNFTWQLSTTINGVTGVFGPSGAGKTSLLRAIAGLDTTLAGRIAFAGEEWLNTERGVFLPPHKRPIGYVFQDARLLAHKTVAGNLAYAAKRAKTDGALFSSVVAELDLDTLLDRNVQTLSGGERQRVAIGRALLTRPSLLLMDEPLSANDLGRRGALLPYISRVARDFGIPTLYVTHSLDELAALTERTVVCRDGRVVTEGPTEDLLAQHALLSELDTGEVGCLLSGTVARVDRRLGIASLELGDCHFTVPLGALEAGDVVRLHVQPRDVAIALKEPVGLSIRNMVPVVVSDVDDPGEGAWADVDLQMTSGQSLRARLTRASIEALSITPGLSCYALIKTASVEQNPALVRA